MRSTLFPPCTLLCAVCLSLSTHSQTPAAAKAPHLAPSPQLATPQDLPVHKVVLYKNGVGYFEHSGTVNGNQRVAIDFTSAQLNDVLQSLTVLDEGGGRIGGVNYNSTTPLAEQLKALSLGLKDFPSTLEIYHALRGQRMEVTGSGAPLTGRLVNVEFRRETDKNGQSSEDHYFLVVATDAGALRTVELTDSISVHMLDPALQKQFNSYLEILAAGPSQQGRHLTLSALGQGQRQLRVSYISEVPVWKSTYRMVFPREANGKATVQGWAVVDNTVGADWENVQLSLVAGAPQSFIQPLSQPLYTHRKEIPITLAEQLSPETHAAAETASQSFVSTGGAAPKMQAMIRRQATEARGANETVAVSAGFESGNGIGHGYGNGIGAGYSGNIGGGVTRLSGVDRVSDAFQAGDVSTNAFDDFFEYALTQPVTIHKNESAMVPILQQDLPAEHVTLWNEHDRQPLRAVWLKNESKLTLDSGSFSIFEAGEFAGEGLLDPIHPGERRLLSYAVDQAVRVQVADRRNDSTLHHVEIHRGAILQTNRDVASTTYSAVNSGDADRVVLIEYPRHGGNWQLDEGQTAAETAPGLYRFRLAVAAHSTASLEVKEHGTENTTLQLNSGFDQRNFLFNLIQVIPEAKGKLEPIINAQEAIDDLDNRLRAAHKVEQDASGDESRARENLTALKGNDAAKRFVDELNRAEDLLQSTRKQIADLEAQKKTAADRLDVIISALDWEFDVQKTGTRE
jgi:hypothetical protein